MHDRRRLEVRKCCSTSWREAHASTCQRPDRCRDKVGYAGRDEAKNACRVRRERYGNVLTEYLCPSCGMYHIGHPLPGQRGWDEATS